MAILPSPPFVCVVSQPVLEKPCKGRRWGNCCHFFFVICLRSLRLFRSHFPNPTFFFSFSNTQVIYGCGDEKELSAQCQF